MSSQSHNATNIEATHLPTSDASDITRQIRQRLVQQVNTKNTNYIKKFDSGTSYRISRAFGKWSCSGTAVGSYGNFIGCAS